MIALRELGRTKLKLSELGFGAAEMGFESATDSVARELFDVALEGGINFIDTGECYADSEAMVGRHLAERRNEFYLLTKCGHASGLPGSDWAPATLAASIDRSLQRMRTDFVDILLLHSCSEKTLREGAVMEPLLQARSAGKVRFLGYSGDGPAARFAASMEDFDCLEVSINVADQEAIELVLPLARERRLGIIAKRSIANAAWKTTDQPPNEYGREYWERLKKLDYPFLKNDIRTAVAMALGFTLSVPGVSSAVVGTKSPTRLRENLEMAAQWQRYGSEYEPVRLRWSQIASPDWVGLT